MSDAHVLRARSWARIHGLQSRSALNGSVCRLLFWHAKSERWATRLPASGESIRLRPLNLEPSHAPLPPPRLRGAMCSESKLLLTKMQDEMVEFLAGKTEICRDGAGGIRLLFQALSTSSTFVTEFFGRRPFVLECGVASAHQWTLEDQLTLLTPDAYPGCKVNEQGAVTLSKVSKFTHPAIGQCKAHSFMAVPEHDKELTPEGAKHQLRFATWVLGGGNCLAPTLSDICSALQDALDIPFITTNVYMSHLDAQVTAPLHTDRFDSFIFQTEGSKRWRVFGTSLATPTWPVLDAGLSDRGKNGDVLYLEQVGALMLDECLSPGDVLYLPRGHPHATSTFDTASLHANDKLTQSAHSTSLTVSLLLESLGLTYDKFLRCAAGILQGLGEQRQCPAAEEVLRATPQHHELRQVLPVGFLSRAMSPGLGAVSSGGDAERSWGSAVAAEAYHRAQMCGLQHLLADASRTHDLFERIAAHLEEALPAAKKCCKEKVFATGGALVGLGPDERHAVEEKALIEFPFYPEEGRIYVQAPSIQPRMPVL